MCLVKTTILMYIIIIIIISFMQGIYTHIPETNYVPREYGVAAIPLFLFMVLISLVSVFIIIIIIINNNSQQFSWFSKRIMGQ